VYDPEGILRHESVTCVEAASISMEAGLEKPWLWWPNGQGDPLLYRTTVELLNSKGEVTDGCAFRMGFRSVRLVMNPGAWEHFVSGITAFSNSLRRVLALQISQPQFQRIQGAKFLLYGPITVGK
jgi:hypothetical protein